MWPTAGLTGSTMGATTERGQAVACLEYAAGAMVEAGFRFDDAVTIFRRVFTTKAVSACAGNRCRAAEKIGIHRNSVNRQLRALPGRKMG